jgi:uncharacterized membrane protein YgcG
VVLNVFEDNSNAIHIYLRGANQVSCRGRRRLLIRMRFGYYARLHVTFLWLLPLPIVLLLAASISPSLISTALASPAAGCAGPVAGQHIYDCAGILSPSEITYLETQAAAVESAGAPTVVYLQVHEATSQDTLQDAIDLMSRWDVESRPGAHDGFVMFFNLQPGNLQHGEVALYSGAKYFQNGTLPQSELDRIRVDVMTPLLQQGQTAGAIAAGLQAVAQDLHNGPSSQPVAEPTGEQVVAGFSRVPLTVLGLLFVAVVTLLWILLPEEPRLRSEDKENSGLQRAASPGDLPPAMAGALVSERINDAQLEGTVLDFAGRGLLDLQPLGATSVKIHLHRGNQDNMSPSLAGYERDIWDSLVSLAGSDHDTIQGDQLAYLHQDWDKARYELRHDMIDRGWFDPASAASRRRPFYILGRVGMVAAIISLLLIVASNEGWAAIGMVLFLGAGLAAFIRGYLVREITLEGEKAAGPWHAYQAKVTALEYDPKLDTDLPYIVALNIVDKLSPRLKAASERGYSPAWFSGDGVQGVEGQRSSAIGFYPSWIAFHSGMAHTYGGGGFGGFAGGGFGGGGFGGGAAIGGGGSAGRF